MSDDLSSYSDSDDSVSLRSKRQRTSSGKNPATEALEAVLSSDDELFAFDWDFEPTSVVQIPSFDLAFLHFGGKGGHHHHHHSSSSLNAVSEVTCGFARLSTGTATRAA